MPDNARMSADVQQINHHLVEMHHRDSPFNPSGELPAP
jgi:hypothetical protein